MGTPVKLSDYLIDFLARHVAKDVFLVSGGGVMHLLDAVGRHPELRYYCNYHEQACAIAAEGHARITGRPGLVLVTTGPGGTNALSGLAGAFYDSVPVVVVSGQVRRDLIADYGRLRQVGPQEGAIMDMARPVTKYCTTLMDPQMVRYEAEKALHLATSGRPGPVWIEVPLDVQAAMVDPDTLPAFTPPPVSALRRRTNVPACAAEAAALLRQAKRPMIIAGNGIHRSRAEKELTALLQAHQLAVALPLTAKDLVPEAYPYNMGIFGTAGMRRANFAVQNTDLLVCVGSGLNVHKAGFNFPGFAPKAKKVLVDIDPGQLNDQVIRADLAVEADAREFLVQLSKALEGTGTLGSDAWRKACTDWRARYSPVEDKSVPPEFVNVYEFMDALSDALTGSEVVVAGNGLEAVAYWQAFRVREGQRTMINGNWGAMGWDLPTAVGACIGAGTKRTICLSGDGSLQWNVHELMTVARYKLPLTIFVFNNRGYSSIRGTQDNFFESRYVGADEASGVANPDFEKLAAAYGLRFARIGSAAELKSGLPAALAGTPPLLCEVNISPKQGIVPKASAFRRADGTLESRPLEDMSPPLSREELAENMGRFE